MLFNQSPEDKLHYIKSLQAEGKKVIMVGDGLNDAGALQQSHAGIAVTDHSNYFTPACDAILEGKNMAELHQLIRTTSTGKKIVAASFALSILVQHHGHVFCHTGPALSHDCSNPHAGKHHQHHPTVLPEHQDLQQPHWRTRQLKT